MNEIEKGRVILEINIKKIEQIIYSDIPTTEIEVMTGMTAQNINKYRRRESDIKRMSLENANKFCLYFDSLEQQGRVNPITKNSNYLDYVLKFDSLPNQIKCLLVIRKFDSRGFSEGLNGFNLIFNSDRSFFYTQIHSGVGGGHPIYEFTENTAYIIPLRGYVTMSAGTIIDPITFEEKYLSKWELYTDYLNDIDNIKNSLSRIIQQDSLTKELFEAQYQRIS